MLEASNFGKVLDAFARPRWQPPVGKFRLFPHSRSRLFSQFAPQIARMHMATGVLVMSARSAVVFARFFVHLKWYKPRVMDGSPAKPVSCAGYAMHTSTESECRSREGVLVDCSV